MSTPAQKAKTAFAEEAGRIAALVQKEIQTGAPSYPLKRIPETTFDPSLGHAPRTVRWQTVPPTRSAYVAMLPGGNESTTWANPVTGDSLNGYQDQVGRGDLPAEKIRYGYEEFGRCLRGTALETDPIYLMDILEKKGFSAVIAKLRTDLPRYAKEHFANNLLRDVIQFAKFKYSVAEGFPVSSGVPTFPCVPTGGASIGHIRQIENVLRSEGWDTGSDTPMLNGRPALQVYMGRDSIEFAVVSRKKQREMKLETSLTIDDKTFGQTEVYEGIQFLENPLPPRGYIVKTGANSYEFREINPWIVKAGAEGIIKESNPEYRGSFINVGGSNYLVVEVGYIIHPKAMERQAMGALPNVDGKNFKGMFNFEVNLIPDWAIQADPRNNKDGMYIAYRMTHAYAPLPYNPELMTAFIYLAATPQYIVLNPNSDPLTAANQPVGVAALPNTPQDSVIERISDVRTPMPIEPDCDTLFPANGVGVMRFSQIAYDVAETAGNLTVVVERVGGSSGAASVAYTTTAGTATASTNYTTTSGTLNWADGVFGKKSVVIPIINDSTVGDDDGKQFTVVLSSATGAALGTPSTATVTILDPAA